MKDITFYQTLYDGLTGTWSVYSVTESSSESDPVANIGVLEQTPLHSVKAIEQSTQFLRQLQCIVWHPVFLLHNEGNFSEKNVKIQGSLQV